MAELVDGQRRQQQAEPADRGPDPVAGRYKDASWQAVGEELQSLLTTEEYDSVKRTTFNAFYTSPTVIAALHEAIRALPVLLLIVYFGIKGSSLFRPIFGANHRWAMARGEQSLELELRRPRAANAAERAAVPAPPGPTFAR